MEGNVRAEYKYDGVILSCDLFTVHRLHVLLRDELGVAGVIPDGATVKYICVRVNVAPPTSRMNWLGLAAMAVVMTLHAIVAVVVFCLSRIWKVAPFGLA